jgi:hypothetical protein
MFVSMFVPVMCLSACAPPAGNSMNNSVWECRLPPHFKKPSPSAAHAVRDRYIRDKYELKKYLDWPEGGRDSDEQQQQQQCAADVVRACEINDISLLFKCIAMGGSSCFLSCDTFPLHVAARRDSSACCMLLLVSGSDVLEKDANNLTAAEVARMAGHEELANFLQEREDHVLAGSRSHCNSNASHEDGPLQPLSLNNEFEQEDLQQTMKDMVSKALSSSDDDTDLAIGSGSDIGLGSNSRETILEDITE